MEAWETRLREMMGGKSRRKKNQDNLGAWTSQRRAIEQGKKASSNWCLAHPWRLKQPMNREWLDGRIRSHRPAHEIACDMGVCHMICS